MGKPVTILTIFRSPGVCADPRDLRGFSSPQKSSRKFSRRFRRSTQRFTGGLIRQGALNTETGTPGSGICADPRDLRGFSSPQKSRRKSSRRFRRSTQRFTGGLIRQGALNTETGTPGSGICADPRDLRGFSSPQKSSRKSSRRFRRFTQRFTGGLIRQGALNTETGTPGSGICADPRDLRGFSSPQKSRRKSSRRFRRSTQRFTGGLIRQGALNTETGTPGSGICADPRDLRGFSSPQKSRRKSSRRFRRSTQRFTGGLIRQGALNTERTPGKGITWTAC